METRDETRPKKKKKNRNRDHKAQKTQDRFDYTASPKRLEATSFAEEQVENYKTYYLPQNSNYSYSYPASQLSQTSLTASAHSGWHQVAQPVQQHGLSTQYPGQNTAYQSAQTYGIRAIYPASSQTYQQASNSQTYGMRPVYPGSSQIYQQAQHYSGQLPQTYAVRSFYPGSYHTYQPPQTYLIAPMLLQPASRMAYDPMPRQSHLATSTYQLSHSFPPAPTAHPIEFVAGEDSTVPDLDDHSKSALKLQPAPKPAGSRKTKGRSVFNPKLPEARLLGLEGIFPLAGIEIHTPKKEEAPDKKISAKTIKVPKLAGQKHQGERLSLFDPFSSTKYFKLWETHRQSPEKLRLIDARFMQAFERKNELLEAQKNNYITLEEFNKYCGFLELQLKSKTKDAGASFIAKIDQRIDDLNLAAQARTNGTITDKDFETYKGILLQSETPGAKLRDEGKAFVDWIIKWINLAVEENETAARLSACASASP